MRYAGWEFDSAVEKGVPLTPDFGNNTSASAVWNSLLTHVWIGESLTPDPSVPEGVRVSTPTTMGFGLIPLSGELLINFPNTKALREEKKVWIQLTWMPEFFLGTPTIELISADTPDGDYTVTPVAETHTTVYGLLWTHSVFEFSIFPNPTFEQFRISGDIYLDEVVVDTWCVPEPATICLLGIGSLSLLLRRR
ncbi:MAG: PEP-CTERM sorting domain-containing protein [Kiritimatiellae bacterium]|nr:PEP-CTERM sorting domain-containing protein [Kiritimatiellia bacterium]